MDGLFQLVSYVVLVSLVLLDLFVVSRRPHVPSMRESAGWVGFYVALALAFAVLVGLRGGGHVAGAFVAGWLTEYSLSIDNLFVFVVIMSRFAVPRANQQLVLMIGIILSLILRGACIVLGAAAIERFSWVFYLFGGFLIYTAVQLARGHAVGAEQVSPGGGNVISRLRNRLPVAAEFDGGKMLTRVNGRRMVTPMVLVFLTIGSTDLLFALDSIPAIFGLTKDPFIVFTATLFALMGLRQLYFLLDRLLERLVYLSVGLSIILGFIGCKLILEALDTNEVGFINGGDPIGWALTLPTWVSLSVVVSVLAITTMLSLCASRRAAVT